MNIIGIQQNNQKYIKEILKKYPGIDSGRKNYKFQYKRVLKNILLSQAYSLLFNNQDNRSPKNISFKENSKSISIIFT